MAAMVAKLAFGIVVLTAALGVASPGEASTPESAAAVAAACSAPAFTAPSSDSEWAPFQIRPGQPY